MIMHPLGGGDYSKKSTVAFWCVLGVSFSETVGKADLLKKRIQCVDDTENFFLKENFARKVSSLFLSFLEPPPFWFPLPPSSRHAKGGGPSPPCAGGIPQKCPPLFRISQMASKFAQSRLGWTLPICGRLGEWRGVDAGRGASPRTSLGDLSEPKDTRAPSLHPEKNVCFCADKRRCSLFARVTSRSGCGGGKQARAICPNSSRRSSSQKKGRVSYTRPLIASRNACFSAEKLRFPHFFFVRFVPQDLRCGYAGFSAVGRRCSTDEVPE